MQRLLFADLMVRRRRHHHIAITPLDPHQVTYEHTHDFPEIFLVTSGEGVHERNGRPEPLKPGTLVFVPASDRHRYRTAAQAMRFHNLAFAPDWWRAFSQLVGEPRPTASLRRLPPAQQADATALLDGLLATDAPSVAHLLATAAGLWRLLAEGALPAGVLPDHRALVVPPEWLARLVADWRDPELLREPIAFWQKRSGRSPEHFARTCRRYFGAPPTELLNRARIERVKALLRAGESKVLHATLEAGFQNLGFFYRVFRRLEKCSPREWLARQNTVSAVPRGRAAPPNRTRRKKRAC